MAENPIKRANNYIKILILRFVKRFYQNPQLQYPSQIIRQWNDNLVRLSVEILINGIIGYLALFGLIYLIPSLRNKIYLGNSFWHIPFAIILIGIVLWFIRETYKWVQSNKKTTQFRMRG